MLLFIFWKIRLIPFAWCILMHILSWSGQIQVIFCIKTYFLVQICKLMILSYLSQHLQTIWSNFQFELYAITWCPKKVYHLINIMFINLSWHFLLQFVSLNQYFIILYSDYSVFIQDTSNKILTLRNGLYTKKRH